MVTKNIKEELKKYFLLNPTKKLRLRQIERETQLSFPLVSRYSKELVREKILKTTITAEIVLYSADRSSKNFILEKKLFNIKLLYESNLVSYLIKELSNPVIILFGSFSKGEDIEDSDIDLFVETVSKKELDLKNFENKLQRRIQIFKNTSIRNIKNINLANNIINGINLNREIEVFKNG